MGAGPLRRMTPRDLGLDPRQAGLQDGRSPLGGLNAPLSQIARSFRRPTEAAAVNGGVSAFWMVQGGASSFDATSIEPVPWTAAFPIIEGPYTLSYSGTDLSADGGIWLNLCTVTVSDPSSNGVQAFDDIGTSNLSDSGAALAVANYTGIWIPSVTGSLHTFVRGSVYDTVTVLSLLLLVGEMPG